MERLNSALNHFWVRWRDEYLAELRESHRYMSSNSKTAQRSTISVGDVVIIHDENLPRAFWKLGRVESIMTGRDGEIRAATVRLSSGSGTLHRPVQLLYPLEIHDDQANQLSPRSEASRDIVVNNPSETDSAPPQRVKRMAALEVRDQLKALAVQDSELSTGLN